MYLRFVDRIRKKKNFWWTSNRDICNSLEQGHCLFACVKLLAVILFLHLLAMARNGMAGTEGG